MNKRRKIPLWLAVAMALTAAVVFALRPTARRVGTASVTKQSLTATITAEGRSGIRDLYLVTSPVDGEAERVTMEVGDSVSPGQVIVRIGPLAPRPLDARSRAAAEAGVRSARAAVLQAEASWAEAEGAVVHAESELARGRRLIVDNAIPRQVVEQAEHEAEIRRRAADAARAAVDVARSELSRAEVLLSIDLGGGSRGVTPVRAPVAGRILRVVRQSGGPVATGELLFEIGNLATLEFRADLLTADAMSVEPGAEATILEWGGPHPLAARVRRIEPAAFTKISALGLEEQRVRVILDLTEPPPSALGHDFRVTASIAVWKGENVLTVPSTALFRVGRDWALFVVEGGRARLRHVTPGRSDGRKTVIETGVRLGEEVIVQPYDQIGDGTRVVRTSTPEGGAG